jgi:hypothetical protein
MNVVCQFSVMYHLLGAMHKFHGVTDGYNHPLIEFKCAFENVINFNSSTMVFIGDC